MTYSPSVESAYPGPLARGAKGPDVRRLQEFLVLAGHPVELDGDFGPATARALANATGFDSLGTKSWDTLTLAHRAVFAGGYRNAYQRAKEIREVGANAGPWVRAFMRGREGLPWCAGFVSTMLDIAPPTFARPPWTMSCDEIAKWAKAQARFVPGTGIPSWTPRFPTIFLVRKSEGDWNHTGLVMQFSEETFTTLEGNTNDDGSREGYGVFVRTRAYGPKYDFVLL